MAPQRLATRILKLMLAQPDKAWSYEELARLLNSTKKVVCVRCIEMVNVGILQKVLISTGRPRGRTARVSLKKQSATYPSWLCPDAKQLVDLHIQTTAVVRHLLDDGGEE